jgi:hypothetical protein
MREGINEIGAQARSARGSRFTSSGLPIAVVIAATKPLR